MPRKRVIIESAFKNWDEVNEALRQIAEKKSAIDARTATYNEDEAKRRSQLDEFCNPIRSEIIKLEEQMSLFSDEHRADFGKRRSKELPNGIVGFRLGTPKVRALRGFTLKSALQLIKKSNFKEIYLRLKEELNKEIIISDYQNREIDADGLKQFGLEVVQQETFGYEFKVASNAAKQKPAAA